MENRSFIHYLDEEIVKTRDLCDLNNLLSIKMSTCKHLKNVQKIRFDLNCVLSDHSVKFDVIFAILVKAFEVCVNTLDLLEATANYIENNHSNIQSRSNIIIILKFLFAFFTKEDKPELLFEHVKAEFVCNFLLSELNNVDNKAESYETLISYFNIFSKQQQINCINEAFQFCSESNDLNILCALVNNISEIFLFDDTSCFVNDSVWSYVATCISSVESHLQKQGEYILYICANSPIGINRVKCLNCLNRAISWQAFFILIEVGREKQLHLVEPSLNLFKHICALPFIWQKCIYKVFLRHTQSLIVCRIAIHILKQSYVGNDLEEIIPLIFHAINKNETNNMLSCKMFNTLRTFSARLDTIGLAIVIKDFIAISWNVVSFWQVIQNVLSGKNRADLPATLCQGLITCAVNLPHIYIRNECIEFLVTALWNEQDYDKVYKIVYSVTLNVENVDYFDHCRITKRVAQTAIDDILKCNNQIVHFHKSYTLFYIISLQQINALQVLGKTSNSDFALLAWNWRFKCDQFKDSTAFLEDAENFIIDYFSNHLREDTVDTFIQLCKKYSLRKKSLFRIFAHPDRFNNSQLYAVLKLKKIYIFCAIIEDVQIKPKIVENCFSILFLQAANQTVIKSNDWKVCKASLDFICNGDKISFLETQNAIQIFQHLLDSQSNNVLPKLYETVHDLLLLTEAPSLIIDFIPTLHKNLFQIKKDQNYKCILSELIKIVYSESYFRFNSDAIVTISNDMVLISESCPFVRFTLLKEIKQLCLVNSKYHTMCLGIVTDLYFQGTVISNDERTHFNMCQEVIDKQGRIASVALGDYSNPNLLSAASRLLALENLLLIGKRDPNLLLNTLKERYLLHFKKRYFPGSRIHYEKLRILQAMLLLVNEMNLPEDIVRQTSCFVFDILQEESNQNCIKQILNCILIFLLQDITPLLQWIKSNSNISPTALVSVIPAIYHLTLLGNENTLQEVIKVLLPWTMGPQLKSRVYSQDCVQRLIAHGRQMNYFTFLERYDYLADCVNNVLSATGEVLVNTLRTDLIILKYFNPLQSMSWLAALHDIPRLNNVCQAEWQNLQDIISNTGLVINASQSEDVTFSNAVDEFISKSVSEAEETNGNANEMLQLQTKIVPWKVGLEQKITEVKSDFILVASLIDKSQNLGGLSRTCEVFGIRDVVFNNVKVTGEKEFKSLSMSSESWINRIEVKVKDLKEYLLKLKSDGYDLIGAEQTVGSQKLDTFHFPRKMALMLGNEKTGIPPDIIPLLSICLEIPQFGQTRSLNVHVAGAMFIWEYAKQHLINRNS